jgi:hypothetical protein
MSLHGLVRLELSLLLFQLEVGFKHMTDHCTHIPLFLFLFGLFVSLLQLLLILSAFLYKVLLR